MCGAKANRHKYFIDTTLRVVRRPARHVLKQANRADATIGAEVEPVQRAARNANQIAGFDFDCQHSAVRRMNVEESVTGDGESHFVLIVPVFAIELCEHFFKSEGCRVDVDDVGSDVAAALLESF